MAPLLRKFDFRNSGESGVAHLKIFSSFVFRILRFMFYATQ
jgi:hypothetical protein